MIYQFQPIGMLNGEALNKETPEKRKEMIGDRTDLVLAHNLCAIAERMGIVADKLERLLQKMVEINNMNQVLIMSMRQHRMGKVN